MNRKKLGAALETTIAAHKLETVAAAQSLERAATRTPNELHNIGLTANAADANAVANALRLQVSTAQRNVKKMTRQLTKLQALKLAVDTGAEFKLYEPKNKEFTITIFGADGAETVHVIDGATYRQLRFCAGSRVADTARIINGDTLEALVQGMQSFVLTDETAPLIGADGIPVAFRVNRAENTNAVTGVVREKEEFTFSRVFTDGKLSAFSVATPFRAKTETLTSIARDAIKLASEQPAPEVKAEQPEQPDATEQPAPEETDATRKPRRKSKAHGETVGAQY